MVMGKTFANILDRYRRHCFVTGLNSNLGFLDDACSQSGLDGDQQKGLLDFVDRFKSSEFAILPVGQCSWWETEYKVAYDSDLAPIMHPDAWFDKGTAFRAVVDFVYRSGDELFIIDDKTGHGTPDPWQLKLYAALIPRAIGMSPTRIVCVFNNVVGKKDVIEYCLADLADVDSQIKARLAEVNAWTEFPAAACDMCKWCTVPGCEIKAQAVRALEIHPKAPILSVPKEITTPVQAQNALLFAVFAEGVVDQVKDLLKAYVAANGPVSAGGKIADLKNHEPWRATSIEKIVRALAAFGIPAGQIYESLSITESAVEKLLKKNKMQERAAMVLHYGERKSYKPKFSITNRLADSV
jgi:hypothetical protein